MRKILIMLCIAAAAAGSICFGQAAPNPAGADSPKIYYVDRRLHRLIATDFSPRSKTPEKQARELLSALEKGRGGDILRIIPDDCAPITASLKGSELCVNLPAEYADKLDKNPETERLIVYQLVNSLTSIDGIDRVSFTIGKKKSREFLGYLNMLEIFMPDYLI